MVCKPCIVDLEDPVGFISAEGLDNNNNNLSAYCDWNLYVPYYYVVQLQFVYINIKKNPGCDEDFIAVRYFVKRNDLRFHVLFTVFQSFQGD